MRLSDERIIFRRRIITAHMYEILMHVQQITKGMNYEDSRQRMPDMTHDIKK